MLSGLLKEFDYFGVEINFLYKKHFKYYSSTGGVVFIIFAIVTITYILCSLPAFLGRENMSLIFYDKKIEKTDRINLETYKTRFGIGLTCDGYSNRTHLYDLFDIYSNFVTMKSENGKRKKNKTKISLSSCTKEFFYNEFNSSFEANGFERIFCPNITDFNLSGIYQDELFEYYEFGVGLSEEGKEKIPEVTSIMHNYECRLALHHIDTTINVYDYKDPIKRTIRTEFETLKVNSLSKMNIYFKRIDFDSYENYLFDNHKTKYFTGFSSDEQYQHEKGYSRFEDKIIDYEYFGKFYIRAALERTIIIRKYMKLTEFAANMSSILSQILLLLYVIMRHLNRFFANQSIMKEIFKFKSTSFQKNYPVAFKKLKEIFQYDDSDFEKKNDTSLHMLSFQPKNSLYNFSNNQIDVSTKPLKKAGKTYFGEGKKNEEVIEVEKKLPKISTINKHKKKNIFRLQRKETKERCTLDLNLFDFIIKLAFPCLAWRSLIRKFKLYDKGSEHLNYQMDILTFLRKMKHLEIINYCLLNENENKIVHFLSKPSISLTTRRDLLEDINIEYNINIHNNEIDEFVKCVKYLAQKLKKTPSEQRMLDVALIEITNLLSGEY